MKSRRIFPDLARRRWLPELMDDPEVPREALQRSLAHVARANRYLGGVRSLLHVLGPLARRHRSLSLLDVGVGNGDVSRRLAKGLSDKGFRLRWVGLDLNREALDVARSLTRKGCGTLGFVQGSAQHLPFPDNHFDVASIILTLHHLRDGECEGVLMEMARVSRFAVVVSDLERSMMNYLGARILSATLWRGDPITRHDGPVSVLRSFTRSELVQLGRRAGLKGVKVKRFFPFRLLLEGRP